MLGLNHVPTVYSRGPSRHGGDPLRSARPLPGPLFFPAAFMSQGHNLSGYQLLTVASASAVSPNKSGDFQSDPPRVAASGETQVLRLCLEAAG